MRQFVLRVNSRIWIFLYRLAGVAAGLWALSDLAKRHHIWGF